MNIKHAFSNIEAPLHPKNRGANIQDLLKFFAIISMTIDHLGLYFFPEHWFMRVIGRYAAVVFCFFAGYNYKRPDSTWHLCIYKKHYQLILLWGVLLHIMQVFTSTFYFDANILISIVINLCLLDLVKNYKIEDVAAIPIFWVASFLCFRIWDYGTFPAAIMLIGFRARSDKTSLIYSTMLYCTLMCLMLFEYEVMDFSPAQIFLIFLIFLGTCYCLLYLDFSQKVKYKICLLSRYSLSFYVIHMILIMSISYILGI